MSRANESWHSLSSTCHLSPIIGHESLQTFEGSQHHKMTPSWKHTHWRLLGNPFIFFNCVRTCLCVPAFVCALCMCVPVQISAPPLQLTGRWMSAVTPAWICSCQMRWGHGESTKTLINLNHCPAFCCSPPVASNIYLVSVDAGKSADVHRNQGWPKLRPGLYTCTRQWQIQEQFEDWPPHSPQLSPFSLPNHWCDHHHLADRQR